MSVLSTASVAFSDEIGHMNGTRLARLCRADGVVLAPDAPATAVDGVFTTVPDRSSVPPAGPIFQTGLVEVWQSRVQYDGDLSWYQVLAVDLAAPFVLHMRRDLHIDSSMVATFLVFDYANMAIPPLAMLDAATPTFTISPKPGEKSASIPFSYLQVIPVLPRSGFVLLGELSRYVPVSKRRFSAIIDKPSQFEATVVGSAGERVLVHLLSSATGPLISVECVIISSSASLRCSQSSCQCK